MNKPKTKTSSRSGKSSKIIMMCDAIDAIHQTPSRELTCGIIFVGAGATVLTLGIVLIVEATRND